MLRSKTFFRWFSAFILDVDGLKTIDFGEQSPEIDFSCNINLRGLGRIMDNQ